MLQYSRLQLATVAAVPTISIILIWTLAIFQKNRKSWRCFDTAIYAILIQSLLRNSSIVAYTVIQMIDQSRPVKFEYCSVFVWIFNSIHTFQASTLSTLAVVALFSIRLYRKREKLKNYLTVAHMVYHLFCLTTLCACVGVAAILAKQKNKDFTSTSFDLIPLNLCKFAPHEMDVRYSVFVITLHTFLAFISCVAFVLVCYNYYALRRDERVAFEYVKKSNSDLSEISLGFQNGWTNGDCSNVSTTVSSTNSRRPCLGGGDAEDDTVGLETILPVLTVCYLFNHAPVIVLCLFPWLVSPWSVATAALCLGLLQDVLVPLSLGLVDTRFCRWVSNVYRCSSRTRQNDKLPQVGLDGKFRPFGAHIQDVHRNLGQPDRNQRCFQAIGTEPKFPITNGSLYTSIDGRVPIIHNYRRHKDRVTRPIESHLINLGVHATYLRQQHELSKPNPKSRETSDYSTSHSSSFDEDRVSKSMTTKGFKIESNNLNQSKEFNKDSDSEEFSEDLEDGSITTEANGDFDFYEIRKNSPPVTSDFVTSHEHETFEYLTRNNLGTDFEKPVLLRTFKPMTIESEYGRQFRITRSNSKRSLESFRDYVTDRNNNDEDAEELPEGFGFPSVSHRSYSYLCLDGARPAERLGARRGASGGSVPDLKRIFVSDYL